MEAGASQSWSTSSVGFGETRIQYYLCGAPALMKTAWMSKNFRRRYSKCANENGCKYWDWVDPPISSQTDLNAFVPNDRSSSLKPMSSLRKIESQLQKGEEKKLELESKLMITNMENLLKESLKREEKYFKLLIGTWVLIGCLLAVMLISKA